MKLRGRILIVDDEPINLEFFDVMLSKLGFQVEKAVDGEEALEKVQACNPDLIILDNIMPKLSGLEVTRMLKHDPAYRRYRNTPIIMFSAMNEVKDRIEGFEQGVDDYITKPFNFSEVLARDAGRPAQRELSRQLTRREKRIAVVESLNSSLVFFTQHIKKPISDLLAMAGEDERREDLERGEAPGAHPQGGPRDPRHPAGPGRRGGGAAGQGGEAEEGGPLRRRAGKEAATST